MTHIRKTWWLLFLSVAALVLVGTGGCELEGEMDDAPPILWTANRPHADRGECTNCHVRLDLAGMPLPMIASWARMPHADRGVCTNCHVVTLGPGGPRTPNAFRQTSAMSAEPLVSAGAPGVPVAPQQQTPMVGMPQQAPTTGTPRVF